MHQTRPALTVLNEAQPVSQAHLYVLTGLTPEGLESAIRASLLHKKARKVRLEVKESNFIRGKESILEVKLAMQWGTRAEAHTLLKAVLTHLKLESL